MASKLGGLRKRKLQKSSSRIIPVKRDSSKMAASSNTPTQHACYDSDPESFNDNGSKTTIELDPLTESVRYHVKRTRLATPPLFDNSSIEDLTPTETCQVDYSNTSSDSESMHVLDKPNLVADSITTDPELTAKDSNQTKDSLQSTKEHDEISFSGDEEESSVLRDSGLASIGKMRLVKDEELGLEASQGGEEVASIGDVSLEKIGEDLSDKEVFKASPSPPYSKSNNRRRKGKDGSLKNKSKKAKKRKRKGSEKVEEGTGDADDEKKPKRLAPNFFVAIQIASPDIQNALLNVQKTVVIGDEKLKDAMVPIATMHLTIMVMHLANDDDITRAKAALRDCNEVLTPRFEEDGKLNISFQGLGHFNNQVMFAKIKDEEDIVTKLYDIAVTVEKMFNKHNIFSTGERGFKPHLTVMKLSRAPSLRKKGVRRIKSELYKVHSNELFGGQVMDGLQLCSINKPKSSEGYYYKAEEIFFGKSAPMESINENEPASDLIKNTVEETEKDNKVNDWLESMESTNDDAPDSTVHGDNKKTQQNIDSSSNTNDNKGNNNIEDKPIKDATIIETSNSQQEKTDALVK
ncbi:uncharacterized protein [Amphiura filiformis]|uniref:uncharacterized protein isoform X2 n=1 Tax=Amphiura filiformis TaxID=82378 RepID=UPI003B211BBF